MSLTTLEEIERAAQFSVARRGGYAEAEVDAFLDEVRATIVDLTRRLAVSDSARRELEARLAASAEHSAGGDEQVPARALKVLEMAQRSAEAAIADAELSAAQIVAEAEERAEAREEAARAAVRTIEEAGVRRQEELRESIASLLESHRAARVLVHELSTQLGAVLDQQGREDLAGQL